MKIDMSGEWSLSLEQEKTTSKTVHLPGALQAQGYGECVTVHTPFVQSLADPLWYEREEYQYGQEEGVKIPFLAQPKWTYYGKDWYRKEFTLEAGNYQMFLECVKCQSQLWVDEEPFGMRDSLCAPHQYEFRITKTGVHMITICVDNCCKYPYRPDGHEVSDALAATWNGIAGRMELKKLKSSWIQNLCVLPNPEKNCVTVSIELGGMSETVKEISISGTELEKCCFAVDTTGTITQELRYSRKVKSWDEFEPVLYQLKAEVFGEHGELLDTADTQFGFRTVEAKDGRFYLNHRPVYFRGTHFGGEYPLKGIPDRSDSYWKHIMQTLKQWGLNFLRCHSYCPPEAAFLAADRAGIYLQIECGMWNVFSEGGVMRKRLDEETLAIIHAFGNHPSFVLFSPSNEPGGDWEQGLKHWPTIWKKKDGRRLYTMQSGWPYQKPPKDLGEECGDYLYFHRSGYGIQPGGTIRNAQGFGGKDYRESVKDCKLPVICHELGQWCAYPELSVKKKFTGYMQPGNYEVIEASAKAHHVFEYQQQFVSASGKLQVQMYKEEIEANLRTPHIYGFELLDLHDYLGQGTSVVGILDPFWDEKGYVTSQEWKKFCSETVILLRIPKRVFYEEDEITAPVEVCHFGRKPLVNVSLNYELRKMSGVIIRKKFFIHEIPFGKNIELPALKIDLPKCDAGAEKYVIEIRMDFEDQTVRNTWNLFCYPKMPEVMNWNPYKNGTCNVFLTRNPVEALEKLKDGRRVLLFPRANALSFEAVPLKYYPVFWNTQMGPTPKRNLGMLIHNEHRAFREFPTEDYVEEQWKTILDGAYGMDVEAFGERICNLAQPIDDWNRNKKLSMIFETRIGQGHLLLAVFNPEGGSSNRALAKSLINYMAASEMVEKTEEGLLEQEYQELFCNRAIHIGSRYRVLNQQLPAQYEVTLSNVKKIKGIVYVPDQYSRNHEEEWKEVTMISGEEQKTIRLPSSFRPKMLSFDSPVEAGNLRIEVKSIYEAAGAQDWTETCEGWYQAKREPQKMLTKLPEFYLLEETEFLSEKEKTEFEQIQDKIEIRWENNQVQEKIPDGKKEIEDS